MSISSDAARASYLNAMQRYVLNQDDAALCQAYELGKLHLRAAHGMAELIKLHHDTLAVMVEQNLEDRARIFEFGQRMLDELLSHLDGELNRLRDYQTEQRLLNDRLRKQTQALDQANEALRLAMAKVEGASRAKANFLANMSHEIRTPMNAVIGMTSLLLDSPLDPLQLEFTNTIRSSGEHLLTLINDILDFSKLESSGVELELSPFRLRTCIEEALDLVAIRAAEKGLELAYDIEEGTPPALIGDAGRVRQILLNLLANAVKFTERGEVLIAARATPLRDEKHEVHLAVQDTGIGIPSDRLGRLFLPFSQVDPSTTRLYGGTGLGLAITRMLAERLGGRTWVESELGQGSTFHFTFKAQEATALSPGVSFDVVREFSGMRVLIVDDNATNRRLLSLYTTKWGMTPTLAASGKEALALLRDGAVFDLGLLDYAMPEMDGVELARTIRQMTTAPMRLVLVTSVGSTKDLREHVDAAILKPLKPSTLLDTLIGLFAAARRKPPAPEIAVPVIDRELGRHHPLRILVVEDNPVNQRLAALMLRKLNYTADMAANGREAIEAVERQPYDVVLMDIQMPVLDGLGATREIHQRFAKNDRPRIIAMTAGAMLEDRQQCQDVGMDDYIDKPVQIAALARALMNSQPRAVRISDHLPVMSRPVPVSPAAHAIDETAAALSLAAFRLASVELVSDLRRAADIADGVAGLALVRALRAVCERFRITALLPTLTELESMSPEIFTQKSIVKVAQLQREHSAAVSAPRGI